MHKNSRSQTHLKCYVSKSGLCVVPSFFQLQCSLGRRVQERLTPSASTPSNFPDWASLSLSDFILWHRLEGLLNSSSICWAVSLWRARLTLGLLVISSGLVLSLHPRRSAQPPGSVPDPLSLQRETRSLVLLTQSSLHSVDLESDLFPLSSLVESSVTFSS